MKSRVIFKSILLGASIIILNSCSRNEKGDSVAGRFSGRSIYREQLKIEYSRSFGIEYLDSSKIVSVYSPDKKHNLIFQYVILPKNASIPSGFDKAQIIREPVNSVAVLTSIYVSFLDKLGLLDKLIAVDNFQYINNGKVLNLIDAGKISALGDAYSPNVEKIFELRPDLLFTYGNGNPQVDAQEKLIKNGIHVASSTIQLETSPLARAEWIKFFAVFFDKEKEAGEIFRLLVDRYNKLALLAKTDKYRPKVFTEALFGGIWYEPGGQSYVARLINDAGADFVWKDDSSKGSIKLNYEQVYEKAHDADFWINVHFWNNMRDAAGNDPRNSKFKAFRARSIYNNNALINKSGFLEYWESSAINCDLVLSDLIKIFHPDLLPDYKLTYYKRIEE
jgi:iron complex transport system substrate-binding protein